jgi:hypothetical protein
VVEVTQQDRDAARAAQAAMLIGGFQGDPDVWREVEKHFAAHAARAKAEGIEMAAKAAERCFGPHYPDEQTSCEIVTKTIRALDVG